MKKTEANRFNKLYQRHLGLLKLQGKSRKTIDAYSRSVRRVRDYFDCCPDKLTPKQLEAYFGQLMETHSWSTVKIDRIGLQFFWRFVLERDWDWVYIIKPPKIHTIKVGYRTLKGEDFLPLILQHVLPKGFRRVRDFGFLHGNAKKLLYLVQLVLHVRLPAIIKRPGPVFKCPCCRSPMVIPGFRYIPWNPG